MTLSYHPMASRDLTRAFNWYRKRSPPAASRLLDRVDDMALRILSSPQLFPQTSRGCRAALLTKYPYSLIFREYNDNIEIVAVAHAKRRKSYWHTRVTTE